MIDASLNLTDRVVVKPTADELFDALGEALTAAAQEAVNDRGAFHLALSGGSTPKRFYELLASDSSRYRTIWPKAHIWIVDERRVPESDDRNNFKMIRAALVDRVYGDPYPTNRVHPVPVGDTDPAIAYERTLGRVFGDDGQVPRLDFVLLGIGGDGHTASLFPGMPSLSITDKLVANADVSDDTQPNVERVTMTYPLLNAAREVAVLVTGAGKAATLRRIEKQLKEHGPDRQNLPITGVDPNDGTLTWYLDAAAAGA
jgi:6-phosphogluconolactonase